MLLKALLIILLAAGIYRWAYAEAINVPAIPTCDGGEIGYPSARVVDDSIVFYLADHVMPFEVWEPVICSLGVGQMVQAMLPAKEM